MFGIKPTKRSRQELEVGIEDKLTLSGPPRLLYINNEDEK